MVASSSSVKSAGTIVSIISLISRIFSVRGALVVVLGADTPVSADGDVDCGTVAVVGFNRAVDVLQRTETDNIIADRGFWSPNRAPRPPGLVSAQSSASNPGGMSRFGGGGRGHG